MGTVWELDFYSRPVLGEDDKKLWELLICESPQTIDRDPTDLFRFAQYCPSTTVNSQWLGEAIAQAIQTSGQTPTLVRFFRRQMNNMIVKACSDRGLEAKQSRRTIALKTWLDDRLAHVYPNEPTYTDTAISSPTVQFQSPVALPLPDALQGQQWAIVSLPAADLEEMPEWEMDFSQAFPLSLAGVTPDTPIPGILIFSSRAFPLAAWMSGLELAFVKYVSGTNPRLILETGGNDAWTLADVVGAAVQKEAENFEVLKQAAQGVHFLAIQTDPTAEKFAGFWLLPSLNVG